MEGPSESAPGSSAPPKEFAEPKIDEAAQLAAATVGLVSREEFARRREAIGCAATTDRPRAAPRPSASPRSPLLPSLARS